MARSLLILSIFFTMSCGKSIELVLPPYESTLVVEMYLEDNRPLRCLVTQSVPYADTVINKRVDNLKVVLSDGNLSDTLSNTENVDYETGRTFNYFNRRILSSNDSKKFNLTVVDPSGKVITSTTSFSQQKVPVENIDIRRGLSDRYSVGVIISDPQNTADYYRFLITRNLNDFVSEPTDVITNDIAFNGQKYSVYSEPLYMPGDSLVIRVYSLQKSHYQFLQSAKEARKANFNVFSQPSLLQSNVDGGTGIFTTIVYEERKVVIR